MSDDSGSHRPELRLQIIEAAARLLREGGALAVTTRGVADAASVQPPTIYRLFGDKDGLLDAVAEHVMRKPWLPPLPEMLALDSLELAEPTDGIMKR